MVISLPLTTYHVLYLGTMNSESKTSSNRLLDYFSIANRRHIMNEENNDFHQLTCFKVMPNVSLTVDNEVD